MKAPLKEQGQELSVAEVDELERDLRLAAGGYYEVYPKKPLEQKGWLQNGPPGIVRRFNVLRDILLPVKHRNIL